MYRELVQSRVKCGQLMPLDWILERRWRGNSSLRVYHSWQESE